jgi:hypothetical protein
MSLKYEIEIYRDTSSSTKYTTYHYHGQPHRLNGPAILWNDGDLRWGQYGSYHRLNGPAHVDKNDGVRWYTRGRQHAKI